MFVSYHLNESIYESSSKVVENWYPSIFFHDLEKNAVTWRIFGAEMFVDIDKQNNVMIFTNEIWTKLNEEEYRDKVSKDPSNFSRHKDFDNYFMKLEYGV